MNTERCSFLGLWLYIAMYGCSIWRRNEILAHAFLWYRLTWVYNTILGRHWHIRIRSQFSVVRENRRSRQTMLAPAHAKYCRWWLLTAPQNISSIIAVWSSWWSEYKHTAPQALQATEKFKETIRMFERYGIKFAHNSVDAAEYKRDLLLSVLAQSASPTFYVASTFPPLGIIGVLWRLV